MASKKTGKKIFSPTDIVDAFALDSDKDMGVKMSLFSEDHFKKKMKGVISTQCATLDAAIGRGGIPMSRVTILHGLEGSGKSTLAMHIVKQVQQMGGVGVYIDKECKLDPDYAENIGVDIGRMYITRPKSLEGVVKVIKKTIANARKLREKSENPIPAVIIVDSLNACKAFETMETPTGKKRYPAEARIWSEELPDIVDELSEEYVSLIFVSQVRKKMNVMFGNDEEMAGGFAPRFFASLIVYIARIGSEKDSEGNKVGNKLQAECRKNQISQPFQKGVFSIFWNKGIDYELSLVYQLEDMGLVKKKTATKEMKGGFIFADKIFLGNGRMKAADYVRSNSKLRQKMMSAISKKMKWEE